jgi:predicted regulator of Ras-like GTPase activity (Roadblock/LC7/MglB family)
MATLLGEHPHVKELLVLAKEGEVVYSSRCADTEARATVCNDLLDAAKAVSTHLPLGDFHHLEIVNNQSRTVIQPAQGHHLVIGTPSESPS